MFFGLPVNMYENKSTKTKSMLNKSISLSIQKTVGQLLQ